MFKLVFLIDCYGVVRTFHWCSLEKDFTIRAGHVKTTFYFIKFLSTSSSICYKKFLVHSSKDKINFLFHKAFIFYSKSFNREICKYVPSFIKTALFTTTCVRVLSNLFLFTNYEQLIRFLYNSFVFH